MVEVDVFWSYGIGAGFAFASHRRERYRPLREALEGTAFRDTLLFLACAFAPSGVALLWAFPGWETMYLGTRELPHWLVALFAATNITQGLLGFAVTRWLMHPKHGNRPYLGYLQWAAGYFAMFFILVHGWDGTGYMRFFSPTPEALTSWTWSTALDWLTSPVAHTLEFEALFIVPPILGLSAHWLRQGHATADEVAREDARRLGFATLAGSVLFFSIIVLPALAVGASALVRALGPVLGTLAFAGAAWGLVLRRGGLLYRHFEQLHLARPFFARSVSLAVVPNAA